MSVYPAGGRCSRPAPVIRVLVGASTVAHWFVARPVSLLAIVLVDSIWGTSPEPARGLADRHGGLATRLCVASRRPPGLVTLAAALSVRLPARARPAASATSPVRAAGPRPTRARRRACATCARRWPIRALVTQRILAPPGALALMLTVHIVPSRGTRGIGLGRGLPSRSPPMDWARRWVGSAAARCPIASAPDHDLRRLGLTALALLALRLDSSRELLLASVALFGAGFAATDTMVVKVGPICSASRARRHHGRPHPGLGAAGPRWARRRRAFSTTSPAPTRSHSRWRALAVVASAVPSPSARRRAPPRYSARP